MLFLCLVDAGEAIERHFDRAKDRRQKRALALKDARHVAAKRNDERGEHHEIECDLKPTVDGHDTPFQNRSGLSKA